MNNNPDKQTPKRFNKNIKLSKNQLDQIVDKLGSKYNLKSVNVNEFNPTYEQYSNPNLYRANNEQMQKEIEQYKLFKQGQLFPSIAQTMKDSNYYGKPLSQLLEAYQNQDSELVKVVDKTRDLINPLEGVTTKMMNDQGISITYNQRKADLASILDMAHQLIAQKLQIPTDKVGALVRDLSQSTGITTTDMRLLLLLDDWKETISSIIKKGSSAFKDIIPYGSQIDALIQTIIPEPKLQVQNRDSLGTLVAKYLQPSQISQYPGETYNQYQTGQVQWTFPITTNATGYAYLLFKATEPVASRLAAYYNDATCSSTVIGSGGSYIGALGTYTNLIRWNMEIQTNFTMADNTDYSMEIARIEGVPTDPAMELSDNYYMTKQNRTFNLYFNSIRQNILLRFRGANSTNIGSISMKGTVITTWANNNQYYLDRTLKEVDDDYIDIVEFIESQLFNLLLLKDRTQLKIIADEVQTKKNKTEILTYLKTL